MCGCKGDQLDVIYRFSTKELDQFQKNAEDVTANVEYETDADLTEQEAEEQSEATK